MTPLNSKSIPTRQVRLEMFHQRSKRSLMTSRASSGMRQVVPSLLLISQLSYR